MPLDQERAERMEALAKAGVPADAASEDAFLRSLGFTAPVRRPATAMDRIVASPYKGADRDDPDRAPLRAIPDPLMWAARKQHRDALDALEAMHSAFAGAAPPGTEGEEAWLRAGSVLRGDGRPHPRRASQWSDWELGPIKENRALRDRLALMEEAARLLAGAMGDNAPVESDPLGTLLRLVERAKAEAGP